MAMKAIKQACDIKKRKLSGANEELNLIAKSILEFVLDLIAKISIGSIV